MPTFHRNHWFLTKIDLNNKKISVYDSYPKVIDIISHMNRLKMALQDVTAIPSTSWVVEEVLKTRMQSNGFDCGMWVLKFLLSLLIERSIFTITSEEVNSFRKEIAEILVSTTEKGQALLAAFGSVTGVIDHFKLRAILRGDPEQN